MVLGKADTEVEQPTLDINAMPENLLNWVKTHQEDIAKLFEKAKRIAHAHLLASAETKLAHERQQGGFDTSGIAPDLPRAYPDFPELSEEQKFAIGCAWVLGRWLADAIALVVAIYGAEEIRLAGGPLSGSTGLFVTVSVEKALERVYGFDLEPEWYPGQPAMDIPGDGARPTDRGGGSGD
jgi:hypothetical protein